MAGRQRPAAGGATGSSNGRNPFHDRTTSDDVDDSDFLKPRNTGYVLGNESSSGLSRQQEEYTRKRQQLLDERRAIEDRTLESAKASLGLVYEAEKVGITTAEELVRQGEKLSHIDSNLDAMNSTMRTTQKHLTSMKSMFGGLKNYFSGSKSVEPTTAKLPSSQSESGLSSKPVQYQSRLNETIDTVSTASKNARPHQAFERQGIVFDDEEEKKEKNLRSSASRSQQVDQILDSNLTDLSLGLGRLKNLALGLGSEIESQDEMLTRIMQKEERAEETMGWQNRQMRQILKK